ncbi:MAG: hypothetical protein JOY65_05225 [Acetobacteraceae bacterium]|nr:hypothetical protein [Acetobacteraceae bacterium]
MRRHSPLPSLDALLRQPAGSVLVERFGRAATVAGLRAVLAERRAGPRRSARAAGSSRRASSTSTRTTTPR